MQKNIQSADHSTKFHKRGLSMKSIKQMLLGIAFLIIALCGVPMWMAGSVLGAIMFYVGIVVGISFCLMGFFTNDKK